MRNRLTLIAAIAASLFVVSTTASAVDVTANVAGVFTDNTFTTLDPSFDGTDPQNATADLAAGQGIIISIDIANPTGVNVDAIFTTLIVDDAQVTFLGGSAVPDVLLGGTIFAPTSLTRVAQPGIKGNSPGGANTWVQATAFAAQGGTDGTGPDLAAVQLFFVVNGASGSDTVDFILGLTEGDALNGAAGDLTDASTLIGATINVPEPGTALLMGLGLIGLASAGRRRA
jgi:hypothetical protein